MNSVFANYTTNSPGSESPNSGLLLRPVASRTKNAICRAAIWPPSRDPAHTQNSDRLMRISSPPSVGKRRASSLGRIWNCLPSQCSQATMWLGCHVLGSVGINTGALSVSTVSSSKTSNSASALHFAQSGVRAAFCWPVGSAV